MQLELRPANMVGLHGIATVVACHSSDSRSDLLGGVFAGPSGGATG